VRQRPDDPPSACYVQAQGAACQHGRPPEQTGELHKGFTAWCGDDLTFLESRSSGRMRAPLPDSAYQRGSPGGYVAAVQKRPADQFDDALLNGDYSYEVPAIELIREDGSRRQVLQLAAVKALTTYGVTCLPPGLFVTSVGKCLQAPESGDSDALLSGAEVLDSVLDAPLSGPALMALRTPRLSSGGPSRSIPLLSIPGRVISGLRTLLVRSGGQGLLGAAVWMTLLAPVLLASRRRAATRALEGGGQVR
jgi:hypothetical protein